MEEASLPPVDQLVSEARARLEHRLVQVTEREAVVRAFVPETFDTDRIRADFDAAVARDPYAPLLGRLLGVKDIFHVDGLPTRGGTTIDPGEWSAPQASTVTDLLNAGAIVAAKTVTAELACWRPGPTTNPRHPEHTPGGSSSGSAAAVGAGMVDIGFGTQTIGSTIRPAAYCGVVGWKPTRGRLAIDGVIPYSDSIDHVGLITPTIDLLATVLPLIQIEWQAVDETPLRRVAVPTGPLLDRVADGASSFGRARRTLAECGIDVVERPALDDVAEFDAMLDQITYAEAADVHRNRMELLRTHCDPAYVAELERAEMTPNATRAAILDRTRQLASELDRSLDEVGADAWLTPSAPGVAPLGLGTTGDPAMNAVWTFAGLPTITIPHGSGARDLPLGLQFVGRHGADESLVSQINALSI